MALFHIWMAARKRVAVICLGNPELIAVLSASLSSVKRRCKMVLWFIALTALILALARPRWGSQIIVKTQSGVEVMIVMDVSQSMLAEDLKPSRLTRAKLEVQDLMDRLAGNDFGLVIFSGAAFLQFPLTNDLNTARSFLEAAGPDSISLPGTALEEALRVALKGFPEKRSASRVILLLTDGEGHEGDPIVEARQAVEDGVIIHAIGFGSPSGEPIPLRDADNAVVGYKKDRQGNTVLSSLDETTLQQITATTGGLYFRASAAGEETETIANTIAKMEADEKEGKFEIQGIERFPWFVGLAMLALSVEVLLGERKRDA